MDTETLIITVIDKVRPFLQRDGGDCEFVAFKDGYVYIKMHGACQGCTFVDQTISDGIEAILMEEVPGVLGVKIAE